MNHFPIFLRLQGARVLVVGGGEVAARKIRLLQSAGARIEIVAHELNEELAALVEKNGASKVAAEFEAAQLRGCRLVIAATSDHGLNERVAQAADAAGIPVNVVDDRSRGTFITPSVVKRGPITIAISTAGSAPVLARRLREKLETLLPAEYGRVADFMEKHRPRVKEQVEDGRRVWERFLDSGAVDRLLAGDEAAAEVELEKLLAQKTPAGEVYLVGAGPGDPDLLTFRAIRLMQQADVVLYDRLLTPGILDLVRRDAERVFVGKGPRQHEMSQDEINALLVKLAKQGKRVLRLKGGDPFVFGRGGEEIESLAAERIPFQVVPGITAANGCAAYAGIPLTHRAYAQTCIFVTGHARKDGELELHWDQLARRGQTLVIYMGLGSLTQLCAKLIEHGLPSDWPAALIEEGTSTHQRVVAATLADLPSNVASAQVKGASLVIVGEVVKLHDRLRWFGAGA
ncbi:MAG TPA: siroheme synthase CysG [Nevskiaceae bacterium]|nr:siroheme synthase CysG [Nevskiaceae bacterium]